MKIPGRHNTVRRGLSLLEVLVATAIFLFSLIALGRLIIISADVAVDVQQQAQAAHLAQSKLGEVIAGAVPLQSQSDVPFDEDPDWQWTLDAQTDASITGIYRVQVKVSRTHPTTGRRIESTLSQIVLDPSIRGSNADVTASINTTLASSSASSQSGTSNPSSSNGSSNQTQTTPAASTPVAAPAAAPTKAATPAPSTPTSAPKSSTSTPSSSSKGGKS
jgi:hypothetical protein